MCHLTDCLTNYLTMSAFPDLGLNSRRTDGYTDLMTVRFTLYLKKLSTRLAEPGLQND